MMIKHLFKIIWNQRKSNVWILTELMLVSVCLWYIIDYMSVLSTIVRTPLGFDITDTYRVDINERTPDSDNYLDPATKETTTGQDLLTIMERIRQYPAVEEVSLSIGSQPYAATHYTNQIYYNRLFYKDTVGVTMQRYKVTPSFFRVFRIEREGGNGPTLSDALDVRSIVLSANGAAELLPGENAVGKSLQIGKDGYFKEVKALCTPIRWTEYEKSRPCFYTLLPEDEIAGEMSSNDLANMELCVRIRPDAALRFSDEFRRDMATQLSVGNLYMIDVRPSSLIKRAVVSPVLSDIRMRLFLLFFLVVNIFLGISGTFWFRTQHRRGEMGLRVALGSTSQGLRTLLISEGLVMLFLAMLPAVIICFNLGVAELVNIYWADFTLPRFLIGTVLTCLLMSLMIISGILYPAWRAMKMEPAEALHYE
nr:FtsX-like permease family protein [Parabacteroides goldsteinii]